jgi:hypothetical protein
MKNILFIVLILFPFSLLGVDFDDGFVAYLNGTELARYHMGAEATTTTWDQQADDLHEALRFRGLDPMRFDLEEADLDLMVAGVYTLEVNDGISRMVSRIIRQ